MVFSMSREERERHIRKREGGGVGGGTLSNQEIFRIVFVSPVWFQIFAGIWVVVLIGIQSNR